MFLGNVWIHDLSWKEVSLYLVGIVVIMWITSYIESRMGVPNYKKLSSAEKGWLWVTSLFAADIALVLDKFPSELISTCSKAGCSLTIKADKCQENALIEYWEAMPKAYQNGNAGEKYSMLEDIDKFLRENFQEAMSLFCELWPIQIGKLKEESENIGSNIDTTSDDKGSHICGDNLEVVDKASNIASVQDIANLQANLQPNLDICENSISPIVILDKE